MIEKILEQGGLFAILALVVFFVYKVSWWIAQRLFAQADPSKGNPGGLLIQYMETNKEFLSGLEKRDKTQLEIAKQHAGTLETLVGQMERSSVHATGMAESLKHITDCVDDPVLRVAASTFNASMVEIAKARILELSITPETPPAEVDLIRNRIEGLFLTIEKRHQNMINKMEHGWPATK